MSLIEIKKKLLMAPKGGADVSELFNTSLWTGTGAARTITTGIDSDEGSLVWIKKRSSATNSLHSLFDTIRGAGNFLSSNQTAGQETQMETLSAFSEEGYSLGTNTYVNLSGQEHVGWQFRRAEKFFDIVQYTGNGVIGRAISHNLGTKPGVIIVKHTSIARNWHVYHTSIGATQYAILDGTPAFGVGSNYWSNTEPDDTHFTVGSISGINGNGGNFIAYLFAHDPSPDGIIQCGSYVGNGSTTGPIIDLGWKPQYLMIKNATATGAWQIIDAQRGFTSSNDAILIANTAGVETSVNLVNPSATGFQLASTTSNVNTNGQTYIYMAIREAS